MTGNFRHFEPTFLGRVATRIVNEVEGINRVVYDFTSKPPGTIEWERLTSDMLNECPCALPQFT